MNITTIQQARASVGQILDTVSGKLSNLSERRPGKVFGKKQTTYQNATFTDSTGDTIGIVFKDMDELPGSPYNGSEITIQAHESKTHGKTGLKVSKDKKGNPVLWITPSANILLAGSNGAATEAAAERAQVWAGGARVQPPARSETAPTFPFSRAEIQDIRDRAATESRKTENPFLKRIYCSLAIAADNLDAHLARGNGKWVA